MRAREERFVAWVAVFFVVDDTVAERVRADQFDSIELAAGEPNREVPSVGRACNEVAIQFEFWRSVFRVLRVFCWELAERDEVQRFGAQNPRQIRLLAANI